MNKSYVFFPFPLEFFSELKWSSSKLFRKYKRPKEENLTKKTKTLKPGDPRIDIQAASGGLWRVTPSRAGCHLAGLPGSKSFQWNFSAKRRGHETYCLLQSEAPAEPLPLWNQPRLAVWRWRLSMYSSEHTELPLREAMEDDGNIIPIGTFDEKDLEPISGELCCYPHKNQGMFLFSRSLWDSESISRNIREAFLLLSPPAARNSFGLPTGTCTNWFTLGTGHVSALNGIKVSSAQMCGDSCLMYTRDSTPRWLWEMVKWRIPGTPEPPQFRWKQRTICQSCLLKEVSQTTKQGVRFQDKPYKNQGCGLAFVHLVRLKRHQQEAVGLWGPVPKSWA